MSNFIDMVSNNLNILNEIISNASLFKNKFSEIANIVDSINEQAKMYRKLSVSSIRKDLYDLFESSTDFEKLREELVQKLNSSSKPSYEIKLLPVEIINYPIEILDYDQFIELDNLLDENDKKLIRKFASKRKSVQNDLENYINIIKNYEKKMVKQRQKLIDNIRENVDRLVDIHASYAWSIKNKADLTEFDKLASDYRLILDKSQKNFIITNVKKMLTIT